MIAFKIDPHTLYRVDRLALDAGLSGGTVMALVDAGELRSAKIGVDRFVLGSWFLGYLDRISRRTEPEAPKCPAPCKAPSASPSPKA